MLFQRDAPHPAHRTFGDAVGCTYRNFETGRSVDEHTAGPAGIQPRVRTGLTLPRSLDVVIAEGTSALQTALVYGTVRNPAATVLYLGVDETFFTLRERTTRHLWRLLRPVTNRTLDGCIVISEAVYGWSRPFTGPLPSRVVHPPIPADRYDALARLEPDSPSDPAVVLSVGAARRMKNHARLVDAVAAVRVSLTEPVELVLVGRGHETKDYAAHDWVRTPGFVDLDEFVRLHAAASLYVQPSLADGYGVALLEGMLAGTPGVASRGVGAAHRLPPSQVCHPTTAGLRKTIGRLLERPPAERRELGETQRQSVQDLTEARQAERFSAAFADLVNSNDG
jgi:glycosyltransferase involved in cell wall biosynthesis